MNYEKTWQNAISDHPDFEISELGWEQHVLIDHSKNLVYRYPRHLKAEHKLKNEVGILKILNKIKFNVDIPILLKHTDSYTVYKYIPGEVLTSDLINNLSDHRIQQIGKALGEFLATLHSVPKSILQQKFYKQTISLIDYYRDHLKDSEILRQNRKIDKFLQEISKNYIELVVHGDLHGKNMVINPKTKKLVGIIDFSELEVGDPHQDFRKIFMSDERLLASAVHKYQELTTRTLSINKIMTWAYVNEFANLAHFYNQPENLTYKRAYQNLKKWGQI